MVRCISHFLYKVLQVTFSHSPHERPTPRELHPLDEWLRLVKLFLRCETSVCELDFENVDFLETYSNIYGFGDTRILTPFKSSCMGSNKCHHYLSFGDSGTVMVVGVESASALVCESAGAERVCLLFRQPRAFTMQDAGVHSNDKRRIVVLISGSGAHSRLTRTTSMTKEFPSQAAIYKLSSTRRIRLPCPMHRSSALSRIEKQLMGSLVLLKHLYLRDISPFRPT